MTDREAGRLGVLRDLYSAHNGDSMWCIVKVVIALVRFSFRWRTTGSGFRTRPKRLSFKPRC
jgi:hypothetical protein